MFATFILRAASIAGDVSKISNSCRSALHQAAPRGRTALCGANREGNQTKFCTSPLSGGIDSKGNPLNSYRNDYRFLGYAYFLVCTTTKHPKRISISDSSDMHRFFFVPHIRESAAGV